MTNIFAEIKSIDYIFFIVIIIFGLIIYKYLIKTKMPLNKAVKVRKSMIKSVILFAILLILAIISSKIFDIDLILSTIRFLLLFFVQYVAVAIYVHRLKKNV